MGRARAAFPDRTLREAVPGRAITSSWSGRCHLILGEYDRAEAKLREALGRDPARRSASTFSLRRCRSAVATGRPRRDSWGVGAQRLRDRPSSASRRAAIGAATPPPGLGWRFSASAGAGHNSNVTGSEIPFLYRPTLRARARCPAPASARPTPPSSTPRREVPWAMSTSRRYEGIQAGGLDDHYLYGDLSRRLTERVAYRCAAACK